MRAYRTMSWAWFTLLIAALALPVPAGAAPAAGPGQIEGFVFAGDATSVTVTLRNNDRVRVIATAETRIILRTPVQLTAIRPNDFVGVTSRREPDGSLTALSINIFPPEYKGQIREAQFVMQTGNMMTNAIVFQNVKRLDGRTLYLRLPDGSSVINVPVTTDTFRLTVARITDLKPGMRIVARGASNSDGTFAASSITADVPPK